jgi:hypothetical protein
MVAFMIPLIMSRKRTRGARKIILDSNDEENGEAKDVDGGVSPPICVARPPKRLRRRSKAVVSDSEGEIPSFTLGPSEGRRDNSPGRLVSSPPTRGPRRSNRVTKPSWGYIDHQDADAEDDYNKTLDPRDVTIFKDDPYAEEQTDEDEYESGLETEEQQINQGHHPAKTKTTSRSKRPGTGRKLNRPREPDTFARLHLGSTSIPFCPRDTSTQRRSLWASRLSACLKSYQDQCRDTFERLGDYDEAMEFLGNSQTGPLAKTVASVLLRRNLDSWQQYWVSATSMFGTVKRWYRGFIKKVFPPLDVDTCAVSRLPKHLLGRFLYLQYLAAFN